jgi:uncharacterized membrane protein YedE/YeeE
VGTRVAGGLIGVVFGLTLSWTGLIDPEVIRRGLLFEDPYLILVFLAALATAFAGTQVLRLTRPRALLTGERVELTPERPSRRRIGGAVLFGVGWALAGACPGPIVAQLGQGIAWSLLTMAGVVVGIVAYLRLERRPPARAVGAGGASAGPAQPAATR